MDTGVPVPVYAMENGSNSSTPSSNTPPGAGGSSTPTSGTSGNVLNCQRIPGFSGASPIPEGGRLSNVPFPSNAVATEATVAIEG